MGDRLKAYEAPYKHIMPRRTYSLLRVDMRAGHTYLRGAEKPFDLDFVTAMNKTAEALCEEIQGAEFGYVQSDEISVLYTDFQSLQSQTWFGGVQAKQISIAAATATAAFICNDIEERVHRGRLPTFDARVFTMSDPVEVANYFLWRQKDATRNSIMMVGQSQFSHKELHGVNTNQVQDKLIAERGINWNDTPDGLKRGRIITKVTRWDSGDRVSAAWEAFPAPLFAAQSDNWLASNIPSLPTLQGPA